MSDNDAEGALLELASSLVDEVAAARLVLTGHGPAPPRELTPRQLGLAEAANPDLPASPDRPGHEDRRKHCDYCGGTRSELVPGPDGEDGYRVCADERGCLARHEHRYPPRPDLVPDAVLSTVGDADEAQAARAAQQQAPQQQEPPESQQEGWWQPQGWQVSQYGAYDVNGQWHPALPAYQAYAHTLMNPAHRTHLLSGQARPHYYGGHPGYIPQGVLSGAEPAQEAQGGQQGTDVLPDRELDARGAYEAARGQGGGVDLQAQSPAAPEALPVRPAQSQRPARPPRGRYGRRRALRYQGRR